MDSEKKLLSWFSLVLLIMIWLKRHLHWTGGNTNYDSSHLKRNWKIRRERRLLKEETKVSKGAPQIVH